MQSPPGGYPEHELLVTDDVVEVAGFVETAVTVVVSVVVVASGTVLVTLVP